MSIATDTDRVSVHGTEIRVRVSGPESAPPLLLIHGIGRSLEDWQPAQDLLAERFRVIAMDLPGFGLTPGLPGGPGLEQFARAAVAILDGLGELRPVIVMGNSLGGAVAMTVTTLRPDRVAGLVLVDSAGFGRRQNVDLRPMVLATLSQLPVVGGRFRGAVRAAIVVANQRVFAAPDRYTDAMTVVARAIKSNPGFRETFIRTGLHLATPVLGQKPGWRRRVLDGVRASGVPVLVVWGDTDHVLPTDHLKSARKALPDCRSHLFTDTGHMPQLEHPAQFVSVATEFLDTAVAV